MNKILNAVAPYRKIKLGRGKFTLVDKSDYEELSKYSWCLSGRGKNRDGYYVARNIWLNKEKRQASILMHRQIMGAKNNQKVDHVNGDFLDNRRSNLRICTNAQNIRNTGKKKNNTSGYKGVVWEKFSWRAYITTDYKQKAFRGFESPVSAALAYDMLAYQLHGDFANTNFGVRQFNFLGGDSL